MAGIILYAKKSCGTCKKALQYLQDRGYQPEVRDIIQETPPRAFLDRHMEGEDMAAYLNSRSPIYRERFMDTRPPTKADAIKFMQIDPNLINRPILVRGDRVVFGFDTGVYDEIFGA